MGGYFKKTTDIDLIRGAVKQLLLTTKGERVMLPNYGCNLRKFLFQPLDSDTFEEIRREIETSFYNYIIGARITKLTVLPTDVVGSAGGVGLRVVLSLDLNSNDLEVFDVEVTVS
jgi:phage baseplate assembly protein W